MFKKLWSAVKWFYQHIKAIVSDLFEKGIKEDIVYRRPVKTIIDLALVGAFTYFAVVTPANLFLATIAVVMTGWFFSRAFSFKTSMVGDLLNIFLAIGFYTAGFYFWLYVREVVILLALLIIPRITKDVEEQADVYYKELTPVVA